MGYRERSYDAFISKHWQYHHTFSEKDYNLLARVYSERFRKALPIDKDARILDVACGSGYFLYFLKKEGYRNCYGTDISKEQMEIAKKLGIGNIENLDFFEYLKRNTDTGYDTIVAFDIIEHLKKDEVLEFLDTLYNAVKPGGNIIIGTANAASLMGARTVFADFTHETGFTPESLSQVIRLAGFDVEVFGEKPVAYDIRSAIRAFLWKATKSLLQIYQIIEKGSGRGSFKSYSIFEPKIFAVGKKTA